MEKIKLRDIEDLDNIRPNLEERLKSLRQLNYIWLTWLMCLSLGALGFMLYTISP